MEPSTPVPSRVVLDFVASTGGIKVSDYATRSSDCAGSYQMGREVSELRDLRYSAGVLSPRA
jgi:hypothetical protein